MHSETYYKVEENRVDGCYSWFRITRCNPRSSLSYSIFHRKGQQNRLTKQNDQWRCVSLQFLLTVRVIRSYIYTADIANCLRLFLACRRKEMKKKKPIKSKRKTHDVFHQKPYSKTNGTQKSSPFCQHDRLVVHNGLL